MKLKDTLSGKQTIKQYVRYKMSLLDSGKKNMESLFYLMFSEKENIFAEVSDGYKIRKITYNEAYLAVEKTSLKLSNVLKDVNKQELIGLCLDNSPEWIILFWSILRAGYRPVLANMRLDDNTLEEVFARYNVKAAISSGKNYKGVINIDLNALEALEVDSGSITAAFSDEVYFMSSNTSSKLKICLYTGESFYYQIMDSAAIMQKSPSIKKHKKGCLKLLAFLPFYHIFGFAAVYMWFCFFSRTLVFLKDYSPRTILATVRKHQVTHIFSVPVLWEKIYSSADLKIRERGETTYKKFCRGLNIAKKLSNKPVIGKLFSHFAFKEVRENIFGESIVFLINGGGYVSKEAMEFINAIGYHLTNGYGMTEIGITSVELSESPFVRCKQSVGKPFPSIQYKITADGELLVRSKSMSNKVYVDGDIVKNTRDDWFNTHDLFEYIDGRYYICGRKDDLIILPSGENLNPTVFEHRIYTSGVKRVCFVNFSGANNAVWLVAEVNPYFGRERLFFVKEELIKQVAALKLETQINRIVLTSTPLMGESDYKLNRKKIANGIKNGEIVILDLESDNATCQALDKITQKVRDLFLSALNIEGGVIYDDDNFFMDLGGTSLEYFAMITAIQTEFSITFDLSQKTPSTVREMTNYIKERL